MGGGTLGTLLKRQPAGISCRSGRSAPPFCLGFSAGLLDPNDWNGDVQYKLVSVRHRNRGHQALVPAEVFVFHIENGRPNIIWRTDEADTNAYKITPGTYEHPGLCH